MDPKYKIERLRCDNMELYYEGLENIRRLDDLKYLSFYNVKEFDDWCLDRVSGSEFPSLEVLDITKTKVTERGLQALYRLPTLKTIYMSAPKRTTACELVIALLEDIMPTLTVKEGEPFHTEFHHHSF